MSEFICARCGYACSRCICKRPIGLPANHEVADLRAEVERLRKAGRKLRAVICRLEVYADHSPVCRSSGKAKSCDCGYHETMDAVEAALAAPQPKQEETK